jgi:glycosyltransferase involved in cell wall biosynthesis
MTVAILSDSPTLTTGFGRTTSHIAAALTTRGHGVWCFGFKARPDDVEHAALPYRVWPAQQGGHWTATLHRFFEHVRPDVLLLNMDAYNGLECLTSCAAAGWTGPTVSYVCFDGLPVGRRYVEAQRSCASVWVTSPVSAEYLRGAGVDVAGVAPPGVDRTRFRPDPDSEALRRRAGLAGSTVVGVFATNTQRKQIARAVAGFAQAVPRLLDSDPRLYLHCRPDGYWRLDELAEQWGIGDRVTFAGGAGFPEHLGPPVVADARAVRAASPHGLGYVDRLNTCDVLLNVPYNGDVEQVIPEGQACGIPLLHTDDDGVMADALAGSGMLLTADDIGTGPIGQRLHHVSPRRIADALVAVLTDRPRWRSMRSAGLVNAARFEWHALERAACAMVAPYAAPEAL